MVHRRFWLKLLERAWKERSVVWLAGVRRVGKTCLCQDLPEVEYFDCELPRVRRMMLDPESFLDGLVGKRKAHGQFSVGNTVWIRNIAPRSFYPFGTIFHAFPSKIGRAHV